MIDVTIFRNKNGDVCAVKSANHCESIVCAAVSALVLNAVNSLDELTDERFTVDYYEEGGYIFLSLPEIESGKHNHDVALLLNSLVLGLKGIMLEHENDLLVNEEAR